MAGAIRLSPTGGTIGGGRRRATFEVGPHGTAIPTSQERLEQGFQKAGFRSYPNTRIAEPGMNYVDSQSSNIYRIMDGSSYHPPRLMTHAPAGNPLTPYGATIPSGVKGRNVRAITHFPLEP